MFIIPKCDILNPEILLMPCSIRGGSRVSQTGGYKARECNEWGEVVVGGLPRPIRCRDFFFKIKVI